MSFLCCKCLKKKKPTNTQQQIEINTKGNIDPNNNQTPVEDSIFSNDSPDHPNKNKKFTKRKSSKKIISNMSEIGNLKQKGSDKRLPHTSERIKDDVEVLDNISNKDIKPYTNNNTDENDNRLDSEPNEVYYIQNQDKEFAHSANQFEQNKKFSNKNLFIVENSDKIKSIQSNVENKTNEQQKEVIAIDENKKVNDIKISNFENQHIVEENNNQNTLRIDYRLSDDESKNEVEFNGKSTVTTKEINDNIKSAKYDSDNKATEEVRKIKNN